MDSQEMLSLLETRFEEGEVLRGDLAWNAVSSLLDEGALEAAIWMEETGGEPAIVVFPQVESIVICDCSKESPKDRRSLCYDGEARMKRKRNPPASSAVEEADARDLRLVSEDEYFWLQSRMPMDLKTSSWLLTPEDIRGKGGAIFGENRYDRTFIFANSADSYYSSRGFRAVYPLGIVSS